MQLNTIAGRTYNDLNQYPVVSVEGERGKGIQEFKWCVSTKCAPWNASGHHSLGRRPTTGENRAVIKLEPGTYSLTCVSATQSIDPGCDSSSLIPVTCRSCV